MADHATRLLVCQEAVETGRVHITVWDQLGYAILFIIPVNALCARKDVFHEFTLAAYADLDVSLSDLWNTHASQTEGVLPVSSSGLW